MPPPPSASMHFVDDVTRQEPISLKCDRRTDGLVDGHFKNTHVRFDSMITKICLSLTTEIRFGELKGKLTLFLMTSEAKQLTCSSQHYFPIHWPDMSYIFQLSKVENKGKRYTFLQIRSFTKQNVNVKFLLFFHGNHSSGKQEKHKKLDFLRKYFYNNWF